MRKSLTAKVRQRTLSIPEEDEGDEEVMQGLENDLEEESEEEEEEEEVLSRNQIFYLDRPCFHYYSNLRMKMKSSIPRMQMVKKVRGRMMIRVVIRIPGDNLRITYVFIGLILLEC